MGEADDTGGEPVMTGTFRLSLIICPSSSLIIKHAFGAPGAELGSAGFGQAGGTVLAERQIQFGARMTF